MRSTSATLERGFARDVRIALAKELVELAENAELREVVAGGSQCLWLTAVRELAEAPYETGETRSPYAERARRPARAFSSSSK